MNTCIIWLWIIDPKKTIAQLRFIVSQLVDVYRLLEDQIDVPSVAREVVEGDVKFGSSVDAHIFKL